ncbi:hypothetical protein C5E06_09865 [Pseudoclavibacter sp. RFBI5]|uniref:hypothetical protein n=1 Tax=Pseudoclavibacter sp. RFBI5 TaxID=2080578 RepID=UPI000CE7AFAC|nr:hypothetical protein [Pseudoclavibacter sp. RFBI5]PPG02749.1 hypothetical protein C5E06_09865 [Pseudoclavibacter sp. RFBI5]
MPEPIDHHAEAIRLSTLAQDRVESHVEIARARAPHQMERARMHALLSVTDEQKRTADAFERDNELKRVDFGALIGLSEVDEEANDYLRPCGPLNRMLGTSKVARYARTPGAPEGREATGAEDRELLANLIPLGFSEQDGIANVHEAADRILEHFTLSPRG